MRIKGYLRGLGAGIFISAVLMGIATSGKDTMSDEEVKKRAAQLGMVEEDSVLLKPGTDETVTEQVQDSTDNKDSEPVAPKVEVKADGNAESPEEDKEKTGTGKEAEDEKPGETDEPENLNETAEDIRAKEDRAMGGQNDTAKAVKDKDETDENAVKAGGEERAEEENTEDKNTEEDRNSEKTDDKSAEDEKGKDSFTLQIASGITSYDVAKLLEKGGAVDSASDFDDYLCDNHYDNRINHGVFKIPSGAGYEEIARIITGGK